MSFLQWPEYNLLVIKVYGTSSQRKAMQGKFIKIAQFIHIGNSKGY